MSIGFTLVELLIVVAIIAILAAIAVPNFMEAQTRAKVSYARNSLRIMAEGLEAYQIDQGAYPLAFREAWYYGVFGPFLLQRLTTPVAYLSPPPKDPFAKGTTINWTLGSTKHRSSPFDIPIHVSNLKLTSHPLLPTIEAFYPGVFPRPFDRRYHYCVASLGPDECWGKETREEYRRNPGPQLLSPETPPGYDPSNGTRSQSNIYYYGPGGGFVSPVPALEDER